jgi:hypothetical protein
MAVSAKQFDQLVKRVAGKSSKEDDASQSAATRNIRSSSALTPLCGGQVMA